MKNKQLKNMSMKNLKLNTLANQNLNSKEMNAIKGGADCCCCGCMYQGQPGGSSTSANDSANDAKCLKSENCLDTVIVCDVPTPPTTNC